ncbi:class I SAM-dependent methyltransferase [Terrihabitans sp. B22-R8]|uniref:class I SAM-dependent methyltransferase n=1 Tax=Terrihabitans sp. B22-R8 TaxID=3425128 RepID=UPI00403CF64B
MPASRADGSIYHDGSYLAQNPGWHEEDSDWKAGHVLRLLSAAGMQPSRIAEVGCGGGLVLHALAQALPDSTFTGYEVSPLAYERCAARANDRVRFRFEDLTEAGDRYDLLLTLDVVEHVEDYLGFLRALRPRAEHHIIHLPLDLSVQTVLRASGPLLHARRKVGHLHYFSKETALATLNDAGYEVLDWRYTHAAVDAPGRTRRSRFVGWLRAFALKIHPDWAVRLLGGSSLLVLCR